ncbi:hypothetical protein K474DRAFT_218146 [Panus rudis PR-1116 ss-1]|nr:hypothetical protein K474DRAFT_218146 [Panus rudis PR-1116 ss-1]
MHLRTFFRHGTTFRTAMYPPRGVNTPVPPSHAVVVDTCRIRFPKASVLAKAIHEHEEAAKRARDAEQFLRSVEADIHREGNEPGTEESESQDDALSRMPSATVVLPDSDEDPQCGLTDAGDIPILPDLDNLISEAQEEVGAPKGGDNDEEAQDHANDEEPQAELDWDEDEDLDGEYEEDDGGEYEEENGGLYVEAEDLDVEVVNDTVIARAKQVWLCPSERNRL